ncbi:hypothetical protein [Streptomyces acidiscabies]
MSRQFQVSSGKVALSPEPADAAELLWEPRRLSRDQVGLVEERLSGTA